MDLFWQGGKGVYTALVEASYADGPTASDIIVFHIDPRADQTNQPAITLETASLLVAIMAVAMIAIVYFKKKQKS